MEMQLVKIVGRSELPGRPMLLGTTDSFLEHFGLKNLKELPGVEELSRIPVQTQEEIPLEASSEAPAPEAEQAEPVEEEAGDES